MAGGENEDGLPRSPGVQRDHPIRLERCDSIAIFWRRSQHSGYWHVASSPVPTQFSEQQTAPTPAHCWPAPLHRHAPSSQVPLQHWALVVHALRPARQQRALVGFESGGRHWSPVPLQHGTFSVHLSPTRFAHLTFFFFFFLSFFLLCLPSAFSPVRTLTTPASPPPSARLTCRLVQASKFDPSTAQGPLQSSDDVPVVTRPTNSHSGSDIVVRQAAWNVDSGTVSCMSPEKQPGLSRTPTPR